MAQDIGILKVEPLDAPPLAIAKVEPLEVASYEPLERSETTALSPPQEAKFQQWVSRNKIPDVDHPDSHYDYRGFWQEHGDQPVRFGVDHFPDTYKQHGHKTFSVESQYSAGPGDGGRWEGDTFIASKAQRPPPMVAAGFSNPDSVRVSTPVRPAPVVSATPQASPLAMALGGEGVSFDDATGQATGIYDPRKGVAQVVKGAKDLVSYIPGNINRGLRMSTTGPWVDDQTKAAASDMIEGAFEIAKPAVALGLATAPITTATALGVSALAARGAFAAAKKTGASDETARLAANIAAVGVTGIATHQILKAATAGVEKVAGDARAVASQARAFDAAQPPAPTVPTEPIPVGRGGTAAAIADRKGLSPVPPPQIAPTPVPEAPPIDTAAALETLRTAAPDSPQGLTAVAALQSAGMSLEDITAALQPRGTQTGPRPDAFKPIVVPPRAPAVAEPPVAVAKFEPETPKEHEFSSTQVDLPPAVAEPVKALAAKIPEADLAKDGREDEPHVTVKYGLHTADPEAVRAILADEPPITVKLGETSVFADEGSGDVVKIDVDSQDLHRLNQKIADAVEHTDTHPDYTPHVTLAHVKPGKGKDYAGDASLSGTETVIDRVSFSGSDGTITTIPLGGTKASHKKPVEVGDTVRVKGKGTDGQPIVGTYTGTPELNPGNAIIETANGQMEAPREQLTLVEQAVAAPGAADAKPAVTVSHDAHRGRVVVNFKGDSKPQVRARLRKAGFLPTDPSEAAWAIKIGAPGNTKVYLHEHDRLIAKATEITGAAAPTATVAPSAPGVTTGWDAARPPGKPPTPQVPNEPGTKYVLPSFATRGAEKPVPLKPAETLTTKDGTEFTVQPLAVQGSGEKATKVVKGPPVASDWKEIGKNAIGQTLYEGPRGVRSYIENGVRHTEAVSLRPTRAGMEYSVNRTGDKATTWNVAQVHPAAQAEPPAEQPGRPTGRTESPYTVDLGGGRTMHARDAMGYAEWHESVVRMGFDPEQIEMATKAAEHFGEVITRSDDLYDFDQYMEGKYGDDYRDVAEALVEGEALQPRQAATGVESKQEDGHAETAVSPSDRKSLASPSPEDGEGSRAARAPSESRRPGGRTDVSRRSESHPERDAGVASEGDDEPAVGIPAERAGRPAPTERPSNPVDRRGGSVAGDHVIDREAELAIGGDRTRVKANLEAVATLKRLESEGRPATADERDTLAKFVGWGGLSGVFKEGHKDHAAVREALTDEEYRAAARSTPNAHYTSPVVIGAMYDALARFGVSGPIRFLEPSGGIGHFLGLMPPELAQHATRSAVELDAISGRIIKALYPNARVQVTGIQDATLQPESFDVIASNVPFGDYGVHDKAFKGRPDILSKSIHNYFFAKALDLVRPGGVVAFITSHHTMDAQDRIVREYLAKHASLLGAIRLPNTAFKKNAGTEVVTDVIFLQKRQKPLSGTEHRSGWAGSLEIGAGGHTYYVNGYFITNPQMVLGRHSAEGSQYAEHEYTVEPTGDLAEQLTTAVAQLPRDVYVRPTTKATSPTLEQQLPTDYAPADVREGAWFLNDKNKLHVKEKLMAVPAKLSPEVEARVRGMMKVRDALRSTMKAMLEPDAAESTIKAEQKKLNTAYDKFVARHGYIAKRANIKAFHEDDDIYALLALEEWKPKAEAPEKAAIFTRRVLRPHTPVTHVDSGKEALLVVLNETGRVDWPRMAALTGRPETELQDELQGRVFHDPATGVWEEADRYLSGNVKAKLKTAQAAERQDAKYSGNVTALEAVQPADLEPADISVRLGSPWVPARYITSFATHLGLGGLEYRYLPTLAKWVVDAGRFGWQERRGAANTEQWGTSRRPGDDLLLTSLNLGDPTVYDTVMEGGKEKQVVNQEQTIAARDKQQAIQDEFKEWIWGESARATALARIYNDTMNTSVRWEPNGDHLTLEGASPAIKLRPHQKNFIWRGLQQPNNLAHHVVGAGKTFAAIALAMEKRRLGLARKPLVTVPNHLPAQWAKDVKRLYPAARILFTEKKDFEPANRKRLLNRIATGDWDMVILPYTHFGRIPLKDETFNAFLQKELDGLEVELERARRQLGKSDPSTKELEKAKLRLEKKFRKAKDDAVKDEVITFEDLGVDMLIVDEAHNFKKLYFPTKMTRVAGVPTQGSKRAFDAYIKIRHLESVNRTGGTTFLTGTPISNTMAEMFVLLRYLAQAELDARGIPQFDGWAATFGEKVTAFEISPTGKGFRQKTRFARFTNMPELMQIYRSIADVQTADMLKLPTPKLKGGGAQLHPIPATTELKNYVDELLERYEAVLGKNGKQKPDPRVDNPLLITTDGRKAALDLRLVGIHQPEGGKVDTAGAEIHGIWKREAKRRGTQLVFSDLGTPADKGKEFSVYAALKTKLIELGIPEKEIAFIHDANTDARKTALFESVQAGDVRVLIGSTEKMGAGTNVQDRLVAEHHLDAPWRPSDIEQREGRILRQGNLFGDKELGSKEYDPAFEVEIHTYLSEGSFDAYIWQLLENKARFIQQAIRGDSTTRELDDADDVVVSFGAAKAVATGNPAIMEHAKAQSDLGRLEVSEANHGKRRWRLQKALASLPEEIAAHERILANGRALADARTMPAARKELGFVLPNGKTVDGDDATTAVLEALEKSAKGRRAMVSAYAQETPWVKVGTAAGLDVSVSTTISESTKGEDIINERWKIATGNESLTQTATIGKGALASLWHFLQGGPDDQMASATKNLTRLRTDLDVTKSEEAKPYPHAGTIKGLREKIKRLENEMNLDAASLAKEAAAVGTIVTTQEEEKADAAAERAQIAAEEGDDEPDDDGPSLKKLVKGEEGSVSIAPIVDALTLTVDEGKRLSDFLRFVFAPDTRTNESRAGAGTLRAEIATRDHHLARFQTLVTDIEKVMDGWSKDESLEFWDVMQGKAPASGLSTDRQVVAKTFRDGLDFWTKEVVKRGLIKTYLEHYWPQEWVKPSGGFAGILTNVFARRPIQGPESFRRHRTIPSTREGVETFGLEPVSWNPATQMMRKIAEMANSVKAYDMRLGLKRQGLMKYVPEGSKSSFIKDGKLPRGWVLYPENFVGTVFGPPTVKVPFGRLVAGRYYGPKEVVTLIKNHLSPGLSGKSKAFDTLRKISALHTQLLLGWSGFHMWLTGWESVASKQSLVLDLVQRGKFKEALAAQLQVGPQGVVRDWLRGRQAVKEYYEHDVDQNRALTINMVDQIIQAGGGVGWSRLEHQNAPHAVARNVRGAVGAVKRGDIGEAATKAAKALALSPFAAIALPTQVVMRHWVPYLKVAAFLDMAKMELETLGPGATLDQRRRRLGEVWDTVDNRFGLLRYDNLFWNNAFKDAMTATIRAVGFTGGTFREFGGAPTAQWKRILDNLTPPAGSSPGGPKGPGGPPPSTPDPFAMPDENARPWIHPKTLHLFSTLMVIMLGGALVMALKAGKAPKDLHDLLHPENGEIDPVTGEPRREDLISYLRTIRSWTTHPFRAAASSVQSLYTSILEALENEDGLGTEVRNPDDPALRQWLDALEHIGKAALPIPIQNAERLATGTDSLAARAKAAALQAIEPTVPTSAESQRTAMEQYLRSIAPPMHRTQEQAEKSKERRNLREAIRTTPKGAPIPKTDISHLSPGSIRDTVKKAGQAATLYGISRADFKQALKAYELGTEDERYQIRGAVMRKLPAAIASTPKDERAALMTRYRAVMALPYTRKAVK